MVTIKIMINVLYVQIYVYYAPHYLSVLNVYLIII